MSKSTLLTIPLEIKNHIFEYLLLFEVPIEVMTKYANPHVYDSSITAALNLSLPIFSVNKQISLEARTFLYGRNEFKFETTCNLYTLKPFLSIIGEENAALIQRITIPYPGFESDFANFAESYGALPIGGFSYYGFNLDDMNIQALRVMTRSFPNLKFLKMSPPNTPEARYIGGSKIDEECIFAVDEHLKGLPKDTKIVLDVQLGPEDSEVREAVRRCGWYIKS